MRPARRPPYRVLLLALAVLGTLAAVTTLALSLTSRASADGPAGNVVVSVSVIESDAVTLNLEIEPASPRAGNRPFALEARVATAMPLRDARAELFVDVTGIDVLGRPVRQVGSVPAGAERTARWMLRPEEPGTYVLMVSVTARSASGTEVAVDRTIVVVVEEELR